MVHYELKDTGMHILSCLALYTDPSGEKKHFKKFYKFQVRQPLPHRAAEHAYFHLEPPHAPAASCGQWRARVPSLQRALHRVCAAAVALLRLPFRDRR